jgi:hypothetical protein
MPMAEMADLGERSAQEETLERSAAKPTTIAPVASPYHAKLAALARDLAANASADPTAIRAIRQRLVEWCEDVRSVGGLDPLAAAVEAVVARITAALGDAAALFALATELTELSTGGTPTAPAPPTGRRSFWK